MDVLEHIKNRSPAFDLFFFKKEKGKGQVYKFLSVFDTFGGKKKSFYQDGFYPVTSPGKNLLLNPVFLLFSGDY